MNRVLSMKKLGDALAIGALSLVFGCESVALLPRENIADRGSGDRREEISRDRDRSAGERDSRRDEILGTVQNVDERNREIRVRTEPRLKVANAQQRASVCRLVLDDLLVLQDRSIVLSFLDVLLSDLESLFAVKRQ